jgi:hypothetical protein
MTAVMSSGFASHDVVIKAAAVADFAPCHTSPTGKIKKAAERRRAARSPSRSTPDIARRPSGGCRRGRSWSTFAAETDDRRGKRAREARSASGPTWSWRTTSHGRTIGFDTDQNEVAPPLDAERAGRTETRRVPRRRVIAGQHPRRSSSRVSGSTACRSLQAAAAIIGPRHESGRSQRARNAPAGSWDSPISSSLRGRSRKAGPSSSKAGAAPGGSDDGQGGINPATAWGELEALAAREPVPPPA